MSTTNPATMPVRSIWFTTAKNGRRMAWYWSTRAVRAIRMPIADAEFMIATGHGVRVDGHPLKF